MSMLNPNYMAGQAEVQGKKKKKKNKKAVAPAPMQFLNFQTGNYLNMPVDAYVTSNPAALQAMIQTQTGANAVHQPMASALYTNMVAQPPPPPPGPPQVGGYSQIDFSKDVNFNNKDYKKRSRPDGENKKPAKKVRGSEITLKPGEKATIFMGGLNPTSDEADITEFFTENGINVVAVRKKVGKMFGHIDCTDIKDFRSALSLNGTMFMGSAMRLEKSSGFQGGTTSTAGKDTKTLFIANLAESVTEKTLREFFPDSLEVRFPVNRSGQPVGYAFLQYDDEEKVKSLIQEFQGVKLEGNSMILDYAAGKSNAHKGPSESDKDPKNLFIGNLTDGATKEKILELFPKATEVRLPADKSSYCFVKFDTAKAAQDIVDNKKDITLDGNKLIIDYAVAKAKRDKDKSGGSGSTRILVVKNLSFKTTEARLKQEFPEVHHVRMVYFPGTERPRGYAFLEFATVDDADDAYYELNQVGRTIHGRVLVGEYALEKGSQGYKERGRQMEEEKLDEYRKKSLWGAQGMAYEGFDIPNSQGGSFQATGWGMEDGWGNSGDFTDDSMSWEAGFGNDYEDIGKQPSSWMNNTAFMTGINNNSDAYGINPCNGSQGGRNSNFGSRSNNFSRRGNSYGSRNSNSGGHANAFGGQGNIYSGSHGNAFGGQGNSNSGSRGGRGNEFNGSGNKSSSFLNRGDIAQAKASGWGYKADSTSAVAGFGDISAKAKASDWGYKSDYGKDNYRQRGDRSGGRGQGRGAGYGARPSKKDIIKEEDFGDGTQLPFSFTGRTGK